MGLHDDAPDACVEVWAGREVPDKYRETTRILEELEERSVLDVGCRDGILQRYLADYGVEVEYAGVDLQQNASGTVRYVVDVSQGIPLTDQSVDAVVALDLLEHLDDMASGFDELARIARHTMILTLPNMAHVRHRARFAWSGRLGAKYDVGSGGRGDRHRWLTVLEQSNSFVLASAHRHGMSARMIHLPHGGRKMRWVERVLRLARIAPSWWTWVTLYVVQRPTEDV